ncbi:MAG: recombinase, partial [Gammaproteobacteria bacterium]|nr:recombinase [Gammaproteobacteria bacterium]
MGNSTALTQVAKRLQVSEQELQNIVMNTVMPNGGRQVTNDQFVSFLAVANEYKLNPLVKEIYAFPAKGGGIQPIVSIDGWLKIINSNPDFNGMTFQDHREGGRLVSVTCRIYKKGIEHPIEVTEYMDECAR